mgnify:CR=1 FL=1
MKLHLIDKFMGILIYLKSIDRYGFSSNTSMSINYTYIYLNITTFRFTSILKLLCQLKLYHIGSISMDNQLFLLLINIFINKLYKLDNF